MSRLRQTGVQYAPTKDSVNEATKSSQHQRQLRDLYEAEARLRHKFTARLDKAAELGARSPTAYVRVTVCSRVSRSRDLLSRTKCVVSHALVAAFYHHYHHICLINDLSTASITQHKTYTVVNDNKNKCNSTKILARRTGVDTERY